MKRLKVLYIIVYCIMLVGCGNNCFKKGYSDIDNYTIESIKTETDSTNVIILSENVIYTSIDSVATDLESEEIDTEIDAGRARDRYVKTLQR